MRFLLMLGAFGILCLATLTQAQTEDKKPPKKLPPFIAEMLKKTPDEFLKQFDKNKDGLLQKDELPPFLQKAFDKVDRDGDGALNREEVTQLLQIAQQFVPAFPPKGGSPEAIVDGLLKQFDTDMDGKISKAEAKGRLADGFDKLDQNRDGFLDRKELRVVAQLMFDAKGGGPGGAAGGPPDFDALDKDADGRLTKEELKGTPWLARFAEIDTNNDGRLDRREFEAYLRKTSEKK